MSYGWFQARKRRLYTNLQNVYVCVSVCTCMYVCMCMYVSVYLFLDHTRILEVKRSRVLKVKVPFSGSKSILSRRRCWGRYPCDCRSRRSGSSHTRWHRSWLFHALIWLLHWQKIPNHQLTLKSILVFTFLVLVGKIMCVWQASYWLDSHLLRSGKINRILQRHC